MNQIQAAPAVAPSSEVQDLVDRLDRAHSNLDNLVGEMAARLAPVLSNYDTPKAPPNGAAPSAIPSCPLSSQLAALAARYEAIAMSLGAQLNSLAI